MVAFFVYTGKFPRALYAPLLDRLVTRYFSCIVILGFIDRINGNKEALF
ncbi:MAG: hypothetical protein ACJAZP_003758 [Psychromonas sp.]|jgi:hypothetical protein